MPKKQTRRKQQVGGGQFTMYCPLCNLPFNDPYEKTNGWLKSGIGFDEKSGKTMMVGPDDSYGSFPINGSGGKFCGKKYITDTVPGCEARGVVCHSDCITYIENIMKEYYRKNNSYKFTYADFSNMMSKYEAYIKTLPATETLPAADAYMGQNYRWNNAEKNNGRSFFDSPLSEGVVNSKKKIDEYIKNWLSPGGGTRQKKQRKTRRNIRGARY